MSLYIALYIWPRHCGSEGKYIYKVLWIELSEENLQYLALFMRRGLVEYLADEAMPSRRRKKLRGDGEAQSMVKRLKKSPKTKKHRRSRKRRAAASHEDTTFTLPRPPLIVVFSMLLVNKYNTYVQIQIATI